MGMLESNMSEFKKTYLSCGKTGNVLLVSTKSLTLTMRIILALVAIFNLPQGNVVAPENHATAEVVAEVLM